MKNLFLILSLLILGGCSSLPSISKKNNESISLTNTHWVLEDNNHSTPHEITLFIESERVSGNASCNNYFAELNINLNGGFSIKNIGSTTKSCPKMSTEQHFLSILEKVNRYRATAQYLELYQDHVLLLKFKKK